MNKFELTHDLLKEVKKKSEGSFITVMDSTYGGLWNDHLCIEANRESLKAVVILRRITKDLRTDTIMYDFPMECFIIIDDGSQQEGIDHKVVYHSEIEFNELGYLKNKCFFAFLGKCGDEIRQKFLNRSPKAYETYNHHYLQIDFVTSEFKHKNFDTAYSEMLESNVESYKNANAKYLSKLALKQEEENRCDKLLKWLTSIREKTTSSTNTDGPTPN